MEFHGHKLLVVPLLDGVFGPGNDLSMQVFIRRYDSPPCGVFVPSSEAFGPAVSGVVY